MNRKFKMTAGELVSLSIVAVAAGAIAVALSVKSCSQPDYKLYEKNSSACDSITSVIEKRSSAKDSTKTVIKPTRKQKVKAIKQSNTPRQPKQRNYLDEPANE